MLQAYTSRIIRIEMRDGGWEPKKHTVGSISFTGYFAKKQAILDKIFLKSKELEELHKHRSGRSRGSTWILLKTVLGEILRDEMGGKGGGRGHGHNCAR